MKRTIIIIGTIFAVHNAFAAVGYCSNNPVIVCMDPADCGGATCLFSAGGLGSPCVRNNQCMDGFYCQMISSNQGICTPYPDCSNGCTDCESTSWSAHSTGYEKRTTATCNTTTCVCSKKTEYRCTAGYYGTSTNGTSGCTKCPSSDGISGTTTAGAKNITSCNLPAGAIGSDTTGTLTYTKDCYYSN